MDYTIIVGDFIIFREPQIPNKSYWWCLGFGLSNNSGNSEDDQSLEGFNLGIEKCSNLPRVEFYY